MQARGGNTWPSVPGAPTSPVATARNMSASIAFTAPADTGFPANAITGYRVTSTPGGFTGTGLTSPVTVSGLTNGTAYTFTVAAQNVNGYGPESAASNSVTPVLPNYIEDVFSTWLYTGTGASQTITNNIDLSTNGGLVWIKNRANTGGTYTASHNLYDTARGMTYTAAQRLLTDTTDAQVSQSNYIRADTTGFSFGTSATGAMVNASSNTYVSWTFRKQPKFFDVVTYTGNGSSITVPHSLGSAPGCIIVKRTNTTGDWPVYHRSVPSNCGFLNYTSSFGSAQRFSSVTSTDFTINVSTADVNASGSTYVAYLFAHDAGGFGLTGTDNVISCGSMTNGTTVNLGYEPQFVLLKQSDGISAWFNIDNMRGFTTGATAGTGSYNYLNPNSASAEAAGSNAYLTSTGFYYGGLSGNLIYIAIRRGPMAVPTDATKVYYNIARTGTGAAATITSGFPPDLIIGSARGVANGSAFSDFLRKSTNILFPYGTYAESAISDTVAAKTNTTYTVSADASTGDFNTSGATVVHNVFQRTPSFFDIVCDTGTGAAHTISHNLGVAPELMIRKRRNLTSNWCVYPNDVTKVLFLDATNPFGTNGATYWNSTAPTASVFSIGTNTDVNTNGGTYVTYLFATCAGVSKVSSYTGTGATQTIACGFAAGARFVMIKRTDVAGDWYFWDSVRGMVAGTDPSLLFNSTAAEVNANSVYTITTGFQIVSTAAGINASGGTYIFLAIA